MSTHEPTPALPPSRKRSLPARVIRFPIKLVLLLIVGVALALRRHPRVSTVVVAFVVAVGVAIYYFTPAPAPTHPAGSAAATPSAGLTSVQGSLPSPQTPKLYFDAQQAGDANAMWGLLSDSLKQSGTVQQLQAKLDQVKPSLGVIKQITYVGGAKEDDGNTVYLYLLTLDRGGQTSQVTYLFTLDGQGKIVNVE